MIKENGKYLLILIILSYVFLFLGNGLLELTNPDEVFYVQTAKEMVQQKTWVTPYLFGAPQFEKPIFLYWMLRVGFIIFGVDSNFGARFFPALFGMIGVLALYYLGLTVFKNAKKAFICALVLASGGLYIGLTRTVFTDMIFSVFILLSMAAFYIGYCRKERKALGTLGFYVFMGLAVLTKGPLGFLIPFGSAALFLIIKKDFKFLLSKYSFFGLLLFIGISFPWYILMIQKYGRTFTYEFFYNDHYRRLIEAEHPLADTWYFYPGSIFGCMFPWTLYLIVAAYYYVKRFINKQVSVLDIFLACWIGVTFIIFQFAHSKLTSYIVPLFPALAIIGGEFIYSIITAENKNRIFFVISLIMCALVELVAIGVLATQ
ncbi:MAG: glycosyltransferase family 39 protein, partial [Candidatus Omnitrophota bacterium]